MSLVTVIKWLLTILRKRLDARSVTMCSPESNLQLVEFSSSSKTVPRKHQIVNHICVQPIDSLQLAMVAKSGSPANLWPNLPSKTLKLLESIGIKPELLKKMMMVGIVDCLITIVDTSGTMDFIHICW